MNVWHLTDDAPRRPFLVSPGELVSAEVGTWPIELDQAVWISVAVRSQDGTVRTGAVEAHWDHNRGGNSYWRSELGPFREGDQVTYVVYGRSPSGEVTGTTASFRVGPKLYLALLWHQHQPQYRDGAHSPPGSVTQPWVRLHALRDYYSMAALVAEHPSLHLTINLTPVLLQQIEDYLVAGATDRALELTLKPAGRLTAREREDLLSSFFDADWHHQIFPHARYAELFRLRQEGRAFTTRDLRDLQMWFNLAWFGKEFRDGDVCLVTGETVSVGQYVTQGRDFELGDVRAMVAEQYKILRAVVPIHRVLQERGQIEVSSTPFYHPILPLVLDSDSATIDRPGATHPRRFTRPGDADAQVRLALEQYDRLFGRPVAGMWPAEGAVSQAAVECVARHGVRWLATDAGVLRRSGQRGYPADDPDVLCRPYRAPGAADVSLFFRDSALSDRVGFQLQHYDDSARAAQDFLEEIRRRFAHRVRAADRVLTVALDGENAWSAYPDDARPFLHALYSLLERDTEIRTITFSEFLNGAQGRGVPAHAADTQEQLYDLWAGSWIDEAGSAPGVDLGTWIGEPEENRAWELLGRVREELEDAGVTPQRALEAFHATYAAEGSDWFWWLGQDQESGNDSVFDDLFRTHLANTYRLRGADAPPWLDVHLVPRAATWTFASPVETVRPDEPLVVRTNCPGTLTWRVDGQGPRTEALLPVGGVMAGVRRYQLALGPFGAGVGAVHFRFACGQPACDRSQPCCGGAERTVRVGIPS